MLGPRQVLLGRATPSKHGAEFAISKLGSKCWHCTGSHSTAYAVVHGKEMAPASSLVPEGISL